MEISHKDVRFKGEADIANDHHLVIADIKIKLSRNLTEK